MADCAGSVFVQGLVGAGLAAILTADILVVMGHALDDGHIIQGFVSGEGGQTGIELALTIGIRVGEAARQQVLGRDGIRAGGPDGSVNAAAEADVGGIQDGQGPNLRGSSGFIDEYLAAAGLGHAAVGQVAAIDGDGAARLGCIEVPAPGAAFQGDAAAGRGLSAHLSAGAGTQGILQGQGCADCNGDFASVRRGQVMAVQVQGQTDVGAYRLVCRECGIGQQGQQPVGG